MSETKEIVLEPKPETAIERRESAVPMNGPQLGGMSFQNHAELVERASEIAKVLAGVIEQGRLFDMVQGKKHVRVEGWTTLLAMMGIVPIEKSSTKMPDGSYESYVELTRTRDGQVVGGASAYCGMDEIWGKRAEYARKSMATTRATGKAARLGYSWIVVLAGYQPTPFEEMPEMERGTQQAAAAVAKVKVESAKQKNAYGNCIFVARDNVDGESFLSLAGAPLKDQTFRQVLTEQCFAWPDKKGLDAMIITADFEDVLKDICKAKSITLLEGSAPEAGKGATVPPTPQAPVAPIISDFKETKAGFAAFKWNGLDMTAWDKELWPFLKANVGKPAELTFIVKERGDKKYHNLDKVISLNGRAFDMDAQPKNFARSKEGLA